MNETLAQFFITVAGAIIILLLSAIAYFLKKWIESPYTLTEAVNELKLTVALLQTNQGNSDKSFEIKHEIIDKRLNAHSEKLSEHSEAIVELRSGNIIRNNQRTKKQQHGKLYSGISENNPERRRVCK